MPVGFRWDLILQVIVIFAVASAYFIFVRDPRKDGDTAWGSVLVFVGFSTVYCFTFYGASWVIGRIRWAMLARKDNRQLLGPVDRQRHVGVAFADGRCTLDSEFAWDRGFLSVGDSVLVFDGYVASFGLPLNWIEYVWTDHPFEQKGFGVQLVFVRWRKPGEKASTLTFQTGISVGRSRANELAEWLRGAVEDAEPETIGTLPLPLDSNLVQTKGMLRKDSIPRAMTTFGVMQLALFALAYWGVHRLFGRPGSWELGAMGGITTFGMMSVFWGTRWRTCVPNRGSK